MTEQWDIFARVIKEANIKVDLTEPVALHGPPAFLMKGSRQHFRPSL